MKYRSDIDGLRAVAVMSVIAFHSGIAVISGGYIGVDVFFVISGYLITQLIHREVQEGIFSFTGFYKRRAARLLPALSITLLVVSAFGFVFYNNKAFDNLGKELFFSSFGAVNILFAQGVNYFAKDEAYQPLIHLWSLGVEEQFYIVWPIILLLIYKFSKQLLIPVAFFFFVVSLMLSVHAVDKNLTQGYFLLHFRAFELLVGVITALLLQRFDVSSISEVYKRLFSYLGMFLIIIPIFLLNRESKFPGFNAVIPCLGASLIIAFHNNGAVTKVLSHKVFVFVGLISYPLYLFHQPLISFLYFFDVEYSAILIFTLVSVLSGIASWLTYRFIENPIRKIAHSKDLKRSNMVLIGITSTIPFFAIVGLLVAKTGGLEERFKYLNPFALEVAQAHSTTFHSNFKRGFQVASAKHGRALFVGDSVLQHYVLPFNEALGFSNEDVDTVTRGGCVLLKGADFIDKFSDISCNEIRQKLYANEKTYDYVVISQSWNLYGSSVLNFSDDTDSYGRWASLLDGTIEHFLKVSDSVIVIGAHPEVEGTLGLQPSIMLSKEDLLSNLNQLNLKNVSQLKRSRDFFDRYDEDERVIVLEPYRIFCRKSCSVSNDSWSYFSDAQHISSAATAFVRCRVLELMQEKNLTVKSLRTQDCVGV